MKAFGKVYLQQVSWKKKNDIRLGQSAMRMSYLHRILIYTKKFKHSVLPVTEITRLDDYRTRGEGNIWSFYGKIFRASSYFVPEVPRVAKY